MFSKKISALAGAACAAMIAATVFSGAGCSLATRWGKEKGAEKAEEVQAGKVEELKARTPDLSAEDAPLEGVSKIARAAAEEIKSELAAGNPEAAKDRAKTAGLDILGWGLAIAMGALSAWLRGKGAAWKKGLLNTAGAVEVLKDEMQKAGLDPAKAAALLVEVKAKIKAGNMSDGVEAEIRALLKGAGVS